MIRDFRFEAAVAAARKITRLYAGNRETGKALRFGEVACLVVQAIQTYEQHRRPEGIGETGRLELSSTIDVEV